MRGIGRCRWCVFFRVAHVGVAMMHRRRHRIIRCRRCRLPLIVTILEGHLMRQTACPRHERRQRRGLKQDPRARENTKMSANKNHLQPDQLTEGARSRQSERRFPRTAVAQPMPRIRGRFFAKSRALPFQRRTYRKRLRDRSVRQDAYSMTIRPLKIGSFSFVWS